MELQVEKRDGVAIVTLASDHLDVANVGEFRDAMTATLEAETRVVYDLGQVQFIDSSGLGAMLSNLREVTAKGGDLRLCCVNPPVMALFELVRMTRIFRIDESVDAAVAALRS